MGPQNFLWVLAEFEYAFLKRILDEATVSFYELTLLLFFKYLKNGWQL